MPIQSISYRSAFRLTTMFIVACSSHLGGAAFAADTCLGSQDQGHPVVIYLHGIDDPKISTQERQQRLVLDDVGKRLGFRFAVPRSSTYCSAPRQRSLCWPMRSETDIKAEMARLVQAGKACGKNIAGWLGFSNGGYFASKLVQFCTNHPGWVIAIGSAGSMPPEKKASLQTCGSLTLAIGTKDITLKAAREFADSMRKQGARIEFREFAGGHEIRGEILEELLTPRHSAHSMIPPIFTPKANGP